MIAIDAVQRGIILVKKYWGYICVPIFLLAAFIFVQSTHPAYKVTTKIALRDISPQSVAADLRSPSMVSRVIGRLPLQVSYYNEDSPREEFPADSLRARMEFARPANVTGETWLRLMADSADVVGLSHDDTTAYYEFDRPVHETYGDFKIVHGAHRNKGPVTCLVRLQGQALLVAQYAHKLRIEAKDADGSVTVSIVTGTPKKGVAFLNEMLYLYGIGKYTAGQYAGLKKPATSRAHITLLQRPEDGIEEASLNPFWIYLAATVLGLLVPLGLSSAGRGRKQTADTRAFGLPKLVSRIQHRVAVRQLD